MDRRIIIKTEYGIWDTLTRSWLCKPREIPDDVIRQDYENVCAALNKTVREETGALTKRYVIWSAHKVVLGG